MAKTEHAGDVVASGESVADMGGRVVANGGEDVYCSEKLAHAVFKAAEGLALCGVELDAAIKQAEDALGSV
jgi:hypothetical protein